MRGSASAPAVFWDFTRTLVNKCGSSRSAEKHCEVVQLMKGAKAGHKQADALGRLRAERTAVLLGWNNGGRETIGCRKETGPCAGHPKKMGQDRWFEWMHCRLSLSQDN